MLTIAYQTGSVQREIKNVQNLVFESQLPGQSGAVESINAMDNKIGFLDHVGGLRFSSKMNKTDEFNIGFAAGKFGRPNWSILDSNSNYTVDPRIHAQVRYSRLISDKMRFSPNITYQKIMNTSQSTLVVQGQIDYLFNEAKRIVLLGGVGYRSGAGFGDAMQILMGVDIRDIRIMLGYDINISRLAGASGGAGGFELSAQYIGKIYKRPNPDPIIFCPRF